MSHSNTHHIPILLDPICDFLVEGLSLLPADAPAGVILDCTLGGGGHTARILEKMALLSNNSLHCVIGVDRDLDAIARAKTRFSAEIAMKKLEVIHASFSEALAAVGDRPIYGLLADLGISSDQIDSETRGFSFRYPAPLDMRMNTSVGESLADWLSRVGETEIANVIWKYGEERLSRKIARRLIQLRDRNELPKNSKELAEAIALVFPPAQRFKRTHPATQTFQAFRIFLNQELEELETLVSKILPAVTQNGRIAILSFHSLEDRRVKETLRNSELYSLPQRKSIKPSEDEINQNSRSRSAKLRLAIRK